MTANTFITNAPTRTLKKRLEQGRISTYESKPDLRVLKDLGDLMEP